MAYFIIGAAILGGIFGWYKAGSKYETVTYTNKKTGKVVTRKRDKVTKKFI